MEISRYALKNSKPVNVMRFALAFLGLYILFSVPREQYPDIPLYYVHILIPYPGASTEEIEKEITQKVEVEIKSLHNIELVQSLVSDGLSFTKIGFTQSLSENEFNSLYLELKSLINNIDFPEQSQSPIIDNFTYLDFMPITNVVVYAEDENASIDTLMSNARMVKEHLNKSTLISNVEGVGLLEKKVLVSLDKDKLDEYNISLYEINNTIREDNVSIPAGILETNSLFLNVLADSTPKKIEELGNILIRNVPEDIYLKDIALIDYYYDDSRVRIRYNGERSITLPVYKVSKTDSIDVVNDVENILQDSKNRLDNGIAVSTFADTSLGVRNSIRVLLSNALLGFILLLCSLFFFLGWKPALISALEIPFTFATSFFVLDLIGITVNTSTLFALVLVLGMIVDHSIVILENIIRLRHFHNMDRFESVVTGISQIGMPVIASTLTTIGTFLPLAFLPGIIGKFLFPVPITITVTLVISTISALVVIPIHYMEMPGNERTHELKIFDIGRVILEKILHGILKVRVPVCILSLACALIAIFALFKLPVSLYDTENQPFFFVDVTFPVDFSITQSDESMKKLEDAVLPLVKDGTIKSVITAIGKTNPDQGEPLRFDRPNNAQLQIELYNEKANSLDNIDEIIALVESKIDEVTSPQDTYSYKMRKQRTGPPTSSAIGFRILGDNMESLKEADALMKQELAKYDELYNIKSNLTSEKPELLIVIDKNEVKKYGHSVASIGMLIRQWLSQDANSKLFINNQENDILVKLNNIDEEKKANLSYMTFPSRTTRELISFDKIATIERRNVLNSIYREDGSRLVKITADAHSRERIKEINSNIEELFHTTLANSNLEFQMGGEFDEFSNLLDEIMELLIIGIFVVYVLLVAQFKSYTQPILIMLTILFTTIGVSTYLYLSNQALSIVVLYSFVALIGVVVNGAIVLVNTANNIYTDKLISHKNAITQATIQRFKPILLTNITTIVGVLPTAMGISGKSPIWQPMAATISVGLIFSTLTTLLVIPAFYSLLPNRKKRISQQDNFSANAYENR